MNLYSPMGFSAIQRNNTPQFGAFSKATQERRQPTPAPSANKFENYTPEDAGKLITSLVKRLKDNDDAPNWGWAEPKVIIASAEKEMVSVIEQAPIATVRALNDAIAQAPAIYTATEELAQALDSRLAKG